MTISPIAGDAQLAATRALLGTDLIGVDRNTLLQQCLIAMANRSGGGGGTVTDFIFTDANGIAGVVATSTTTPTLTLSLGAITPTSVNGLTLVAAATGFTVAGGTTSKTLTVSNTLSLAGVDGSVLTIPATGTAALLGTANVFTRLQTITQGTANEGIVASTGYSLTGSNATSMIDLAGTWNTSGTPTAIKLNITNTASNASSLLMDLQSGGTTRFQVLAAASPTYQRTSFDGGIGFLTTGQAYNGVATPGGGWSGISLFSVGTACFNASIFSSIVRVTVPVSTQFGWSSDTAINGTTAPDLLLTRKAAAVLQLGTDAAGVTDQMLTACSRITSDGVGANLTIAGGNGRGGAGGTLILSTYDTGAAATAGTLRSRMTFDTAGAVSFPVVTAVTTETVVSDTTWPVTINGVAYKICLKA